MVTILYNKVRSIHFHLSRKHSILAHLQPPTVYHYKATSLHWQHKPAFWLCKILPQSRTKKLSTEQKCLTNFERNFEPA